MKVRLLSTRWDQRTPKGIVRRRRGDQFSVKDEVAEWLIRSGAAEPSARQSSAESREPQAAASAAADDVIGDLVDEQDPADADLPDTEGDADADAAADASEEDEGETDPERPAQAAPKAQWVAYAVSRGIPAKEAESMDKPTLISRTA
ncbi:hypothetical protein M3B38_01755 [Dietzia cinnamea]|uniref:hypothetical protein n=1 Tax=Dietzia cinnamea TaxID=321318 RepID=UPI0021A968DA|nr:hypothetical protein [Dietzia cinnamea]MCT1710713.1 hypothetical protein [Dietzia cinnamea]